MKRISTSGKVFRYGGVALALLGLIPQMLHAGELQSIRDEVRDPADRSFSLSWPKFGDSSSDNCHRSHRDCYDGYDDDPFNDDGDSMAGLYLLGFIAAGCVATSPFWGPRAALGDDGRFGYFPKFPYRNGDDFMLIDDWNQQPKRYGGRIRMEYCENFRDLWRMGGQIQFETTSRFGLDTEFHRFEEILGGEKTDHLWLGDFNVTYRFAQSEWAAWRAGIGFNWMDDPIRTNYGFNFTYGFDIYPCRPWVFSTEFDLGTLGKSELFRFRSTAGIMIHRAEAYVGYEYLNVANTTFNGLISGICIHF